MRSEAEVREAYESLGEKSPLKATFAWVLGIESTQERFDRIVKESLAKNKFEPKVLVINNKYKGCTYGMPEDVSVIVSDNVEEIVIL